MAYIPTPSHSLSDRFASAIRSIGHLFGLLASANRRIAAIDRLSQLSDDQLAARGTTRSAEIQRILGPLGAV